LKVNADALPGRAVNKKSSTRPAPVWEFGIAGKSYFTFDNSLPMGL
jgi:hypothetical protein